MPAAVVTVALAGGPGVMGLALYLTTGHRTGLDMTCLVGLLALYLSRPRLDEWRDILPSTQLD